MSRKNINCDISFELTLNAKCRLTLNQLLINGADINYQCQRGWCLLLEFVVLGLTEEIQHFSRKDMNLYVKDSKGRNALFWAIHMDNTAMVNKLLSLAAYLRPTRKEGLPLFHYAIYKQNPKIIQSFLDRGVDINGKDEDGNTALDYAKKLKLQNMVSFLLIKGAHNTHLEH